MTTYYNVYTEIVREFVSRINTAIAGAGKLSECKKLYVGDIESTLELIEKPCIFLTVDGILESYEAQKREQKSGDIRLNFILVYGLYDDRSIGQSSIYYDDSAAAYTGFLPFIEQFLDVIHSDTSGNIDPRTNQLQRRSIQVDMGRILKAQQHLEAEIIVTCRTTDFSMNRRYSD